MFKSLESPGAVCRFVNFETPVTDVAIRAPCVLKHTLRDESVALSRTGIRPDPERTFCRSQNSQAAKSSKKGTTASASLNDSSPALSLCILFCCTKAHSTTEIRDPGNHSVEARLHCMYSLLGRSNLRDAKRRKILAVAVPPPIIFSPPLLEHDHLRVENRYSTNFARWPHMDSCLHVRWSALVAAHLRCLALLPDPSSHNRTCISQSKHCILTG